jgi:hypothetical protein
MDPQKNDGRTPGTGRGRSGKQPGLERGAEGLGFRFKRAMGGRSGRKMVLEGEMERRGKESRGEERMLTLEAGRGHRTVLHRSGGQIMMCFAGWGAYLEV